MANRIDRRGKRLRLLRDAFFGAPHRYLAPQSIAAIREAHQRYPDFILGRVTRAEPRDVTNDPDSNPYRLPLGTVFHVLAVESL